MSGGSQVGHDTYELQPIAAGKLNITSKEWAVFGLPVGLVIMAVFFVILFVL